MKNLLTTITVAILIGTMLLSGCTKTTPAEQDLSVPQSSHGIDNPENSAF